MIYGRKDPAEEPIPTCPMCEAETDEFYLDEFGNIVGCPECIRKVDSREWVEDNNANEYINFKESFE